MQYSDNTTFATLSVEQGDSLAAVLDCLRQQQKPVVLLSPFPSPLQPCLPRAMSEFKQVERQLGVPLFFITNSTTLARQAKRYNFPTFASLPALMNANIIAGHASQAGQPASGVGTRPPSLHPTSAPSASRLPALLWPSSLGNSADRSAPGKRTRTDRPTQRAFSSRRIALTILLTLLCLSAGGSVLFLLVSPRTTIVSAGPAAAAAGTVTFLSSGQFNPRTDQGSDDEIQVDLHHLTVPAPGTSLYAWLLSDANNSDIQSILLGKLLVLQGDSHLFYAGDPAHTNLLALFSRFLVTEESSEVTPIAPTPDLNAWRYFGSIPAQPNPQDSHHYSLLNHLRHLLASDPVLNALQLPGGLNTWLYRNTGVLLEWTQAARDNWSDGPDPAFIRRQLVRTLTYLDGLAYVWQDLPTGTQLFLDTGQVRMGIIDVRGPDQNPPSFLSAIVAHLNGLLNSPGATQAQRTRAAALVTAMDNVSSTLNQVRQDARRLLAMTDGQLTQPAALGLLDDLAAQASSAYTGQIDPATGSVEQGIGWIHSAMQSLATLVVAAYR